jgi:phage baseplate assembly protein W
MESNENSQVYTSFLGTGWSFPPEFSKDSKQVVMTSDEEDIRASLVILLGTVAGERLMNPKYGLDLHSMLFEPMGTTAKTLLKERIRMSILIYEPRINLLSLELDSSAELEGKIILILTYEIRATNSRFNLVYPFYSSDSNEVRRTMEVNNR